MTKRKVSDILDFLVPIAFVVIDNQEHYQSVCPWCAEDLAVVEVRAFEGLYERLLDVQVEHMPTCSRKDATEMAVELY